MRIIAFTFFKEWINQYYSYIKILKALFCVDFFVIIFFSAFIYWFLETSKDFLKSLFFKKILFCNYNKVFFLILWYFFLYSTSFCFSSKSRSLYRSTPYCLFFSFFFFFRNTLISFTSFFGVFLYCFDSIKLKNL